MFSLLGYNKALEQALVAAGGDLASVAKLTPRKAKRVSGDPVQAAQLRGAAPSPSPYFVPGITHIFLSRWSLQALISYQDDHMILLLTPRRRDRQAARDAAHCEGGRRGGARQGGGPFSIHTPSPSPFYCTRITTCCEAVLVSYQDYHML